MTDKIKEIRARHEAGAPGEMPIAALCQCDADREFLLAEVERLRATVSTLEIVGKASDDERAKLSAEIKRLKQEPELLRAELISLANAARKALADSYDRAREARWRASHE